MNPKNFYENLWQTKIPRNNKPSVDRDWLHRNILDKIFDPYSNSRHQVALRLIMGGQRLLDIGAWNGDFLERINETQKYSELYGIDIVPGGIELIKAKGFKTQLVDLNSESLPFPDHYFDGITMLAVLEHVFDPYFVVKEVHRTLRPGGHFIIAVPNVASLTNRLRILFGRLPITSYDAGWDGGHLHYFTKHALDIFLEEQGFNIIARKSSGGRAGLREKWISLLSGELTYLCLRR